MTGKRLSHRAGALAFAFFLSLASARAAGQRPFLPAASAPAGGFPAAGADGTAGEVNPFPPKLRSGDLLREWTFAKGAEGWVARHDCRAAAAGGILEIVTAGADPYLGVAAILPGPRFVAVLRLRCAGVAEGGQIFWTTDRNPAEAEERSRRFDLISDGAWHEYAVPFEIEGTLKSLRLDPGSGPGRVEADRIALYRGVLGPLAIERVEASPSRVGFTLHNVGDRKAAFAFGGKEYLLDAGGTLSLSRPLAGRALSEAVTLEVESKGFPSPRRIVTVFRPAAPEEFIVLESGPLKVRVASEGSGARIELDGRLVAGLAPLVLDGEAVPRLVAGRPSDRSVTFTGPGLVVRVALEEGVILVGIRADREVEGPVLRVQGGLEQGLFAGLEYLGKGESSSSKRDIETDDHLRFAPDPLDVTMPLAAFVTDRCSAAVAWRDMTLHPLFASPDFLDGTKEHRVSLRGRAIEAAIRIAGPEPVEDAIPWAVERMGGLPPLPEAPRSEEEQRALCLKALEGPLKGPKGWGHCAEARWPRRFYADMVSTLFRLTGRVPETGGPLVFGGSHLRNAAAYFLTGRAGEWLAGRRAEARRLAADMRSDGTFAYAGPFRRGHFEDTASGFCAERASRLLAFARITGDGAALAAGLKALEGMKRFRTPRGAQTWELSLHTPDILAAAYLVRAYTIGFELTGKEEYRKLARRWALSGVPFVYLWSRYPVMLYATVPVYGATNYRSPLWIGRPVQWCGTVYADALVRFAPYDKTLDWKRLAAGILRAAEQMQYPGGPLAGCLPDVFDLKAQRRAGPSINPCALVSLDRALAGRTAGLSAAAGGGHCAAAPFPVALEERKAVIAGKPGVRYQVLVDGKRIVDVLSRGRDAVSLSGR